jgi:predicted permease
MTFLDPLALEVRHAIRRLTRNPAFTIVTSLSLALGIGVTTGAYSVLYAVLLRALPVRDPAALAVVSARNAGSQYSTSHPWYLYLRDHSQSLDGVVAFRALPVNVNAGAATERVTGMLVSGNYFDVLGVAMAAGAAIAPADDQTPGSGGPRGLVAVLGHQFWTRRFGADAAVIGRTIKVNGEPITVVGVAPPDFNGTRTGSLPDVFLPMMFADRLFESTKWLAAPRNNWLRIMVRLKPDVTVERAQAEMTVTFRRFHQDVIVPLAGTDAARKRAREASIVLEPGYAGLLEMGDTVRPTLFSLMGLVALVFLIACTNVAGLMAARAERLQRETAICLALGASRGRVWAKHFVETLLVATGGLGLGLILASWTAGLFTRLIPAGQDLRVVIDSRVLAVSMLLGLLATLVLTAVTARQSPRHGIGRALKGESVAARLGLRKSLIVGQLALSVVVVAAAGLFLQTLANLHRVDTGFERKGILIASIAPGGYAPVQRKAFFARVLDDVRAIPGVTSAALAAEEPLSVNTGWNIMVQRDAAAAPRQAGASIAFISPDYFKTMGIPLLRGRDFDARDSANPSRSVVVNENFVRSYLGDEDPIGARVMGGANGTFEIIGVARDSASIGLRDLDQHMMYLPSSDSVLFMRDAVLHVRADVAPASLQRAIEAVVHRIDPDVPIFNVRTIEQQVERLVVRERTFALLSTAFGFLAVLLSAVGIYGVIANAVSRRTKELGIRLALGAGPRRIFRLVLQEAGTLAALGVVIGVPGVFVLARTIRTLLFGVQPVDVRSAVAAVIVLLAVATLAAWLPARRASRIEPLTALRQE